MQADIDAFDGSDARLALYKFASLFEFERDAMSFGSDHIGVRLCDHDLHALQSAVHAADRAAFLVTTTAKDCRRHLWFVCQTLMEASDVPRTVRRDIVLWADVCTERTYEGSAWVSVRESRTLVMQTGPETL